jgi:hypothetical protein
VRRGGLLPQREVESKLAPTGDYCLENVWCTIGLSSPGATWRATNTQSAVMMVAEQSTATVMNISGDEMISHPAL